MVGPKVTHKVEATVATLGLATTRAHTTSQVVTRQFPPLRIPTVDTAKVLF